MNTYPQLSKILAACLIGFTLISCTVAPGVPLTTPGTDSEPVEQLSISEPLSPSDVPTLIEAKTPLLRASVDYSKSVDWAILAKNIDAFIAAIDKRKHRISGVEVLEFSNGSRSVWSEVPKRFIWGDFPTVPTFQPDMENAPPNARIYKDAQKKYIAEQKATFDSKNAETVNNYEVKTKRELEALKSHLLLPPPVAAPCTRFFELAARMQRENLPLNVLLTDGIADCEHETIQTVSPTVLTGTLIILQVPGHGDNGSSDSLFKSREAFLQTLFPSAAIFPIYMPREAVNRLLP
jgi:hypothetical protein